MATNSFVKQKSIRPRFSPDEFDFMIYTLETVLAYDKALTDEIERLNRKIREKKRDLRTKGIVLEWIYEREAYTKIRDKLHRHRISSRYSNMDFTWAIDVMVRRFKALKEGRYVHRDACIYGYVQDLYKHTEPIGYWNQVGAKNQGL